MRDMFIGDEARAAVNAAAATARLAGLAAGGSLIRVSHAAWGEGTAKMDPTAGLPELIVVHSRGPARRGAASLLILRWEAADASGQRFPVLDADITLVPDGEQATLVGLDGVYRIPPGAGLDPVIVQQAAAATMRSFLGRLAGAITDPATAPSEDSGLAAVWPGCWLLPALTTESRETLTAGWLWQAALTRPAAGRRPAARR
jgi:hypothetical protein